jgi:hypothetical protein
VSRPSPCSHQLDAIERKLARISTLTSDMPFAEPEVKAVAPIANSVFDKTGAIYERSFHARNESQPLSTFYLHSCPQMGPNEATGGANCSGHSPGLDRREPLRMEGIVSRARGEAREV